MSNAVKVKELPKCDFCNERARYDAKTRYGPWANMCGMCWREKAASRMLGTGIGQRLLLEREVEKEEYGNIDD